MDGLDDSMEDVAATDWMADYLSQIAHLDMPLAAKIEMVRALRGIMRTFVDGAWGDDPVQHVHEMHVRDEMPIPAVVSSSNTSPDTQASLSSAFVSPAAGRRKKERS
jgi:hypothetical protein